MNRVISNLAVVMMLSSLTTNVWAGPPPGHGKKDVYVRRDITVVDRGSSHHHHHDAGAAVAAGVAGLAVGAILGSASTRPSTVVVQQPPPSTVVVQQPVVVTPPAYGSVVYVLPQNCVATSYSGVQYYQCNGVFHQPIMGNSGVYYQIVPQPY